MGHFFVGMGKIERITDDEAKAAAKNLGLEIPLRPIIGCHDSEAERDLVQQAMVGSISFGPDDEPPFKVRHHVNTGAQQDSGGINAGWTNLGAHDVFPSGKGSGGRGKRVLDGLTAKDMKGTG